MSVSCRSPTRCNSVSSGTGCPVSKGSFSRPPTGRERPLSRWAVTGTTRSRCRPVHWRSWLETWSGTGWRPLSPWGTCAVRCALSRRPARRRMCSSNSTSSWIRSGRLDRDARVRGARAVERTLQVCLRGPPASATPRLGTVLGLPLGRAFRTTRVGARRSSRRGVGRPRAGRDTGPLHGRPRRTPQREPRGRPGAARVRSDWSHGRRGCAGRSRLWRAARRLQLDDDVCVLAVRRPRRSRSRSDTSSERPRQSSPV